MENTNIETVKKAIWQAGRELNNRCPAFEASDLDNGLVFHLSAYRLCLQGKYLAAAVAVAKACFVDSFEDGVDKQKVRDVAERVVIETEIEGGAAFFPLPGVDHITPKDCFLVKLRHIATKINAKPLNRTHRDEQKMLGLCLSLLALEIIEKGALKPEKKEAKR